MSQKASNSDEIRASEDLVKFSEALTDEICTPEQLKNFTQLWTDSLFYVQTSASEFQKFFEKIYCSTMDLYTTHFDLFELHFNSTFYSDEVAQVECTTLEELEDYTKALRKVCNQCNRYYSVLIVKLIDMNTAKTKYENKLDELMPVKTDPRPVYNMIRFANRIMKHTKNPVSFLKLI